MAPARSRRSRAALGSVARADSLYGPRRPDILDIGQGRSGDDRGIACPEPAGPVRLGGVGTRVVPGMGQPAGRRSKPPVAAMMDEGEGRGDGSLPGIEVAFEKRAGHSIGVWSDLCLDTVKDGSRRREGGQSFIIL